MSVHFLVDYENVHENGIFGMYLLTEEDSVHIFHTSVNDRINLSCLEDVRADVRAILIPPGKQSLDMHLVSYLGYLIGREEDPDSRYVIVSKDHDYQEITFFWNQIYQTPKKVLCRTRITDDCETSGRISLNLPPDSEWRTIREFIIRTFDRYGATSRKGLSYMQFSELCNKLNNLPAYRNELRRYAKKPMQYFRDECADLVRIERWCCQDWACLLTREILPVPVQADAKTAGAV